MSEPEYPVGTDAEQIKAELHYLTGRQDALVEAVNGIGENITWMVNCVQQAMQMFSNPGLIAQLMNQGMAEVTNSDGKHAAASRPA